jgi:hypothetical protein
MILENIKKEEIKKLYKSHGIFLLQEGIGEFFRKISGIALKNEDDIFRAFKTNADGFGLSFIDDIVTKSTSTKNLQDIEILQRQLMHAFNPSGRSENVPSAMEKTKKILNGYAKSKGKNNFQEIKDEIVGKINKNQTGQQQYGGQSNQQYKNNDDAKFYEKQKGTITGTSWFSGKRISNRTIDSIITKIDETKLQPNLLPSYITLYNLNDNVYYYNINTNDMSSVLRINSNYIEQFWLSIPDIVENKSILLTLILYYTQLYNKLKYRIYNLYYLDNFTTLFPKYMNFSYPLTIDSVPVTNNMIQIVETETERYFEYVNNINILQLKQLIIKIR